MRRPAQTDKIVTYIIKQVTCLANLSRTETAEARDTAEVVEL
jgi:hypothetical protein